MNLIFIVSFVLISPCVALLSVILYTLLRSVLNYNFNKNVYSSLPRYPSTIAMIDLFGPNGVKKYFEKVVDKTGQFKNDVDFIGPHLDGTPTCIVNNSDYFKEMLRVEDFPKLPIVYDSLDILLGKGLVTSQGELWKRQRRLLTPLFHFAKLKQMPKIMNYRIRNFCESLNQMKGKEVKPTEIFGKLALEIVIDCVFGGEKYLSAQELDPLWDGANKAMNNYFLTALLLGKQLNNWTPFPWNIKLHSNVRQIRKLVDRAIHLKKQEMVGNNEEQGDLLGSLLSVQDEETSESMPIDLIRDESLTFLFAGHDTTSSLLSWCMPFLATNPHVVSKIRKEADEILCDREEPEFEDIKKFHYCEMVLKETLRMRPPVPLLDRAVACDSNLGDNTLKAGTYVYPFFLAGHFDKRYWKNPFEFRPERFERREDEPVPHSFTFVPFSAGTRNCIGRKFSLMEATLVLVQLLRKFDVHCAQTEDDIIWHFEGTMKPVNLVCSFTPRK